MFPRESGTQNHEKNGNTVKLDYSESKYNPSVFL